MITSIGKVSLFQGHHGLVKTTKLTRCQLHILEADENYLRLI